MGKTKEAKVKEKKGKPVNKVLLSILQIVIICLICVIIFQGYQYWKSYESMKEISNEALAVETDSLDDIYALTRYNMPILLFLKSETCHFCEEMEPTVEELYNEYKGQVIIKAVDVGKNPEIQKAYNAMSYPDLVLINADGSAYEPSSNISLPFNSGKDGETKVYTKFVGKLEKDQIESIIADMLNE